MGKNLARDMTDILKSVGITEEVMEAALREMYERHSYNKHVISYYFYNSLNGIRIRAKQRFLQKKRKE